MSIWEDIQGGSDRNYPKKVRKSRKTAKKERKISYDVADYLFNNYPDVEYRFDVAADVKLTIGQATIVSQKLRHKRGFHDLTILEPRGGYFGLLIELKKDRSEVFRKDGKLKKKWNNKTQSDHNEEQMAHLRKMRDKGYYACYGWGLDHTIGIIDEYMKLPLTILVTNN